MSHLVVLPLLILSATLLAQPSVHPKLAQAQAQYRHALAQHDTLAMADAAYLMGKRFRASGDYATSRKWFLYALKIWEPRGPSVNLNKVYVQLTGDGATVGNFSDAFGYARRALANSRQLNHPHSLMSSYVMLSGLHWQCAQDTSVDKSLKASADSALLYVEKAEAIALTLANPKELAGVRYNWGCMLSVRQPRKAIPLLTYALAMYEQEKGSNNQVVLHNTLFTSYMAIKQLSMSYAHLLKADSICQTQKLVDAPVRTTVHYNWAIWHQKKGQWQLAYTRLKTADSLSHATLTADQRANIARQNVMYETERREAMLASQRTELALRDSRLQVQRQYTFATVGLLALAAAFGTVFYRLNQTNKRISRQNAQLVDEQSHQMKNHYQNITSLLSLQSNRLVDADARRAMEESQLRVHTMAALSQKLYDTKKLMNLGLTVIIPDLAGGILRSYGYDSIQPDYDLTNVPIQPNQTIPIALIINELITNSCKYAFPNNPAPMLHIRCWQEAGRLRLRVQDNGPGIAPTVGEAGFGMYLIAIQVGQLEGSYTVSGPPGFTFDLSL
ncbi:sensor histidine kinase [Fibrella aquatilis]|uniref:histidine kinase n=1 Tax=Fibrella aquatilis TaxID=2817059 RepID=A0A939G3Z1_9BACT|nr:sensor histidine kinase [Fibrella aquatilis]MBO0929807.1 sensor histidine kinase [Fibrella aquatilis]